MSDSTHALVMDSAVVDCVLECMSEDFKHFKAHAEDTTTGFAANGRVSKRTPQRLTEFLAVLASASVTFDSFGGSVLAVALLRPPAGSFMITA